MKSNECDGGLDSAMNVDEEVIQDQDNVNKTMNIILDGRATCIPRADVIYMSDILDSLSSKESSIIRWWVLLGKIWGKGVSPSTSRESLRHSNIQ